MSETHETVWVTKYALTKGLKQCEVVKAYAFGRRVKWPGVPNGEMRFDDVDYASSLEAAVARANEMKVAKIASLRRQIAKLEALEF